MSREEVYVAEVKDYTEWKDTDDPAELQPGVYFTDPDGTQNNKPGVLVGHSAYLMDGRWYVIDPATPDFPAYVQDVYMYVDRDQEIIDSNIQAITILHDLELCVISVSLNTGRYQAGMSVWTENSEIDQPGLEHYSSLTGLTGASTTGAYATEAEAVESVYRIIDEHSDDVTCSNIDNIPLIYNYIDSGEEWS